jgi:hypothetical protein
MKFKKYIIEESDDLRDKIMEFFRKNPNPPDKVIHDMADRLKIDPDELETEIYSVLSAFLAHGNFNESGKSESDIPEDELEMGIKVEMEHTICPKISRRIALDHLSEFPDYYTRLKKMEDEANAALKK